MISNTTEQKPFACDALMLSSIGDSANPLADGNEATQQDAYQTGDEMQLQEIEGEDEAVRIQMFSCGCDEDEEALRLTISPCGCGETSSPHIEDFATFQRQVGDGLKNLRPQEVSYDRIETLLVYWKGCDVPKVVEKAKDLGTLLERAPFNFTITTYEIDYRSLGQSEIDINFEETLLAVKSRSRVREGQTSNLFVLY